MAVSYVNRRRPAPSSSRSDPPAAVFVTEYLFLIRARGEKYVCQERCITRNGTLAAMEGDVTWEK